jgi:hypothetical protein
MAEDASLPIVISDFFTPEECQFMIDFIDRHDKKRHYGHRLQIVNTPDPTEREIALKTLAKVREVTGDNSLYVGDFAPGKYTTPYEGLIIHVDNRLNESIFVQSACLYFNSDYEGGEIYFPELDYEYKPKAGDLMTFDPTHPHGVRGLTEGTRYLVATWFVHDLEHAWDYLLQPDLSREVKA